MDEEGKDESVDDDKNHETSAHSDRRKMCLEVRSTAETEDEGEGRRGRTSAPRKSQNRLRREGE